MTKTQNNSRSHRVDLSSLQADYEAKLKAFRLASGALDRAQIAYDTAREALDAAREALVGGSKTVLGRAAL